MKDKKGFASQEMLSESCTAGLIYQYRLHRVFTNLTSIPLFLFTCFLSRLRNNLYTENPHSY